MPKPGNKNFKLHKQSENLRIFIYKDTNYCFP